MTKAATAEAIFSEPHLPLGHDALWLEERRERALETFRARGIPHRRIEDWKYSDLKSALDAANDVDIGTIAWTVQAPDRVERFDLADLASAPEWVRAHLGKSATEAAIPAASLAFAQGGLALRIAGDIESEGPVRVQFAGSGHARALIVLEAGARATIVEKPATGSFSNIGIEIVVSANAQLTLLRLADAVSGAIQLEDIAVRVARDGTFRACLVDAGASLARTNVRITLKEPGASAELSGVSVLGDDLHADVTTEIYHGSGQTQSTQLFKKVVGGRARGVYQGKITVAPGANGSDSRQTAKALLLSPKAEADLKPELEILADDVKCAHGAAIGDLDQDSLFYLRSRGVPEAQARDMLIHAFLEDALAAIQGDDLRGEARAAVERALVRAVGSIP